APMERAYRDARIARIYEGTNEINRMLLVGMILKRALKGQLDLLGPAKEVANELMSLPSFGDEDLGFLAAEKKTLGKLKKAILMVAGKAAQDLGNRLNEEQELLMALADMVIEVYVAESTLLRTEKLASLRGEDAVKAQVAATQVYLSDAADKIWLAGKQAIATFAQDDDQTMLMMGLKRFTKTALVNTTGLRRELAAELVDQEKYFFFRA
ncbi:MAG: acyl-CoA dehydrogenase family protein, partial [Bacteroidota bacterium]